MYDSNCEIAESVYGRFRFLVKVQDGLRQRSLPRKFSKKLKYPLTAAFEKLKMPNMGKTLLAISK